MINSTLKLFLIEHHVSEGNIYQRNQRGREADGEQQPLLYVNESGELLVTHRAVIK